jgi:hypothetical protein
MVGKHSRKTLTDALDGDAEGPAGIPLATAGDAIGGQASDLAAVRRQLEREHAALVDELKAIRRSVRKRSRGIGAAYAELEALRVELTASAARGSALVADDHRGIADELTTLVDDAKRSASEQVADMLGAFACELADERSRVIALHLEESEAALDELRGRSAAADAIVERLEALLRAVQARSLDARVQGMEPVSARVDDEPLDGAIEVAWAATAARVDESGDEDLDIPANAGLPGSEPSGTDRLMHEPPPGEGFVLPDSGAPPPATVTVVTPHDALRRALDQLDTGLVAPELRIRLAPGHVGANGEEILLTTSDSRGWWETARLPATITGPVDIGVVVDFRELSDAAAFVARFMPAREVPLVIDHGVVLGNHLLLELDGDSVPRPPHDLEYVEPIVLGAANRPGIPIETQAGKFLLSSELVKHLRRRSARDPWLATHEGARYLVATVDSEADGLDVTLVAVLVPADESADEDEADQRRQTSGHEIDDLVLALSTSSTAEELERVLKVGVGYARRLAAAHPALSPQLIHDLIADGTEVMRAAAAGNPNISPEGADLAAADESGAVRAAIAANPAILPEQLTRLADDAVPSVRAQTALNPRAPEGLRRKLACDSDVFVRAVVASSDQVSQDVLRVLAKDAELRVCAAVAANPRCDPEILDQLVRLVPYSVLANPNASPAVLLAGAVVGEPNLRSLVAGNPSTPPKGLRRLARDADRDVLKAVAGHEASPPSARRRALRTLEAGWNA